MPIDVHDEAQGPPTGPNGGGSDSNGIASVPGATPEQLRPHVVAVLRELGVIPGHSQGQTDPRHAAALTGDVHEDENPQSFADPVIANGDQWQLALKKEGNRGRTITILLCLFGLVLTGAVITSLRLPPDQGVERLMVLTNMLLNTMATALAFYFGRKSA
ncbi:hypothetical protein [Kribbella sp. NPDC023855]|uniref:hypothetical protein n=1 Tax=Kribbella sp. NPDC023855 TaxID=3154698 RepID=UPI00340CBE93